MSFSAGSAYGLRACRMADSKHIHEKLSTFVSMRNFFFIFFLYFQKKIQMKVFFCVASRERKSKSALLTTTAESGRITTVQQEIQELSTPAVEKKKFFFLFSIFHSMLNILLAFPPLFMFFFLQLIHSMVHWAQNRKGKAMKKERKSFDNKNISMETMAALLFIFFYYFYFIFYHTFYIYSFIVCAL